MAVSRAWKIRPADVAGWPESEIDLCLGFIELMHDQDKEEIDRAQRNHRRS